MLGVLTLFDDEGGPREHLQPTAGLKLTAHDMWGFPLIFGDQLDPITPADLVEHRTQHRIILAHVPVQLHVLLGVAGHSFSSRPDQLLCVEIRTVAGPFGVVE
jgi:hypothetical protein